MSHLRLKFAVLLLTPLTAAPLFAQSVVPVRFPAGQIGTSITDSITGRDYKDYRLTLGVGQMFNVKMTTLRGSPYFNIIEPGGGDVALFVGSTSGAQFSGRTRAAGAYTIRVYQMRASGRRGETAGYRLTVSARGGEGTHTGHPNAPAHHPGDALVRGTPYHAIAPIRCRTVLGGQFGQCKAGVVRRPGSATVHLETPDGGERTILFRDGRAVSSDASGPLRVTRQGDTSIVRIGLVEVYEIPDALPFGG